MRANGNRIPPRLAPAWPARPRSGGVLTAFGVAAYFLLMSLWWRQLGTSFVAITADDFARALYGWQVTRGHLLPSDLWPPLQFWLVAAGLQLYPHITVVPAAINLAAACVALVALSAFAQALGAGALGRACAVAFATTTPWFVWLSVSGLAEPLYIACLALAYYGVARWDGQRNDRGIWLAAGGLLAASMLRFEAWQHSLIFSAGVAWLWWRSPAPRPHGWLLALGLAWSFPVAWLILQFARHGDPFWFVTVVRGYALTLQRELPLATRLTWQLKDLWQVAGLVLPLGAVGMLLVRKGVGAWLCVAMLCGSFAGLVATTIGGVISVANPTRLVAVYAVLLAAPAAIAVERISARCSRPMRALVLLAVVGLALGRLSLLNAYPNGLPSDTDQVGMYLKQLRTQGAIGPDQRLMIEVLFWDYVMLHVLSDAPEAVVYDRPPTLVLKPNGEHTLDDLKNPSLLALEPEPLRAALAEQQVSVVIAYSERAVAHLRPIADEAFVAGRYHVFLVRPEK